MSFKLIADSGSTKTHWLIKSLNGESREFYTQGLNPYFISTQDVVAILNKELTEHECAGISSVEFYGAGCKADDKCKLIELAFSQVLANADIKVNSDLLGSAIALFPNGKGVACILGTGSNAAVFNNFQFTDSIQSLGYVLGDEGSGNYFGKILLRDFFQNIMPIDISKKFAREFDIDYNQVLNSIYKEPFANRYLARFSVFLSSNRGEYYIENMLSEGFQAFVNSQLSTLKFNKSEMEVAFVGSIAYHFRDVLTDVLFKNGYRIASIIKEPMEGLA